MDSENKHRRYVENVWVVCRSYDGSRLFIQRQRMCLRDQGQKAHHQHSVTVVVMFFFCCSHDRRHSKDFFFEQQSEEGDKNE